MKCNACSKFLICDKKECNFKRIRGVKVRRQEDENRKKSSCNFYRHTV